MAKLSIEIGALLSEITANNTKAQKVLGNVLLFFDYMGPDTDQDKLDFVAEKLRTQLTKWARKYKAGADELVARQAALSDVSNAFED